MKTFKRIIPVIVLVLASLTASGQFTFGPTAAVNFTGFSSKTTIQPGFDAGLFFRFGRNLYFQPEAYYTFTSSSLKEAYYELEENFKIKNHAIAVPLLLGYKIINNNPFSLRVFIGPRFGFLIDSNTKNVKEDLFGTMQYGGELGIGIDIWRFALDFKYGFSVNKSAEQEITILWKEHILRLSLGFKIL